MERKRIILLAILLMITLGNYARLSGNENIRTIQFLSIFVIGALTALLVKELIQRFKK